MSSDTKKRLSAVKHALLTSKLHERRDDIDLLTSEPIAIIGTACRLPGGIDSPNAFWQLLVTGTDAITEIPAERWNRDDYFDADPSVPGKINTLCGGFLEDVDRFDPQAFGIAPREARYIDPQHRLLLEVAWEAFEDSGNPLESIRSSRTGVFFGASNSDYGRMQLSHTFDISAHTLSGTAPSISAGRLSYLFDLRGPSMVIDTACSSSLVAVHTGIQSLRSRDADIAIAGGVSLNLMPEETISLAKWGMLAPDGRCKTFDERANGFVRSEGCGLVVLKRLSDALRDQDTVRAVIRGSAINQDGRSNVLTAPNGEAQRAVIAAALQQAGTNGADISFVETHGTGTKVGDPIEIESLIETIGRQTGDNRVCYLGAVKANLGHLEAAAGVAGLIKLVLCLQHRTIPPQVHFQKLNPLVSLEGTALKIPKTAVAWEAGEGGRIAGLSSFGFSGTNVHMIVEEAPAIPRLNADAENGNRGSLILPISAKYRTGVTRASERFRQTLQREATWSELSDICFTASVRRTHFAHRYAAVGGDAEELRQSLSSIGDASIQAEPSADPRIGFVYSGQGCNWHGMARALLQRETVFEEAIKECDAELMAIANWSILDELHADRDTARLNQTAFFQPALFAIQVGLTKLWNSWGIRPLAVTGHSVGEVAAAHAAGILSLPDAMRIVELRSRLMQLTAGQGAMAAIGLPIQELRTRIEGEPALCVAASNGPSSSTLSGDPEEMSRMLATFEKEGVFWRQLDVACAFHSHQMEPHIRPLVDGLVDVDFAASRVQFFSTVSGSRAGSGEEDDHPVLDAAYWGRNLRDPVLFNEAIGAMIDAGCTAFVEIGPHAVLSAYVAEITGECEAPRPVFASMRRDQDGDRVMKTALAGLYAHGCNPDWGRIAPQGRVTSLPGYPWEKESYWLDWGSENRLQDSLRGDRIHPLLGWRIDSPAIEQTIFENVIRADDPSYLSDHRIGGVCLLPAAAMIEMMLSAGNQLYMSTHDGKQDRLIATICNFSIENPLVIPNNSSRRIQLAVQRSENGAEMRIYSRPVDAADEWVMHASATWYPELLQEPVKSAASKMKRHTAGPAGKHLDVDEFYAEGQRIGVNFGPAFCSLTDISVNDGYAIGRVGHHTEHLPRSREYVLHPILLDGCLQAIDAAVRQEEKASVLLLPVAIERIECLRPWHGNMNVVASLADGTNSEAVGSMIDARLDVTDDVGEPIIVMHGVRMKTTGQDALKRFQELAEAAQSIKARSDAWTYRLNWQLGSLPVESRAAEGQRALIICTNEPEMCRSLIDGIDAKQPLTSIHVLHSQEYPVETTASQYNVDPLLPQTFIEAVQQIREQVGKESQSLLMDVVFIWDLTPEMLIPAAAEPVSSDLSSGNPAIAAALHLMQALVATSGVARINTWIVSRGGQAIEDRNGCVPAQAAIWGLGIAAQIEHPELHCVLLDLDPDVDIAADVSVLWREIGAGRTAEDRVAYRSKRRFVARLSRYDTSEKSERDIGRTPFRVLAAESGIFDDLASEDLIRKEPGPGEVEIETAALGVNFRDVLNALGEVAGPDGRSLGAECAGTIVATGSAVEEFQVGDSVIAFAIGGLASHVTVAVELVARIPSGLDMIEAAGVPVVFLTANYALSKVAELRAGQSVLIHAATGGVGQAAVQLAKNAGATIFATAGTLEKRALLRRLDIEHVFDSRSTAFASEILAATEGQGVDVVLNSLAGEFIPAGLSAVKAGGVFIELGKRDDWSPEKVAAEYPKIAYRRFDLGKIASENREVIREMFSETVAGLEAGDLRALPATVFSLDRISDAFRYMAQGKHIGKIVVPVAQRRERQEAVVVEDATYLITGGLGALGLDMADRLVADGAGQLVLVGRTQGTPEAHARVERLRASGAKIRVECTDVANFDSLRDLIDSIDSTLPTLRGVIHCAGVLRDAAFTRQTWDGFRETMRPKVDGAWNLHLLTRTRTLDFFVLFSSAAAILGWPGQSNYAVGNAYMDALAHYRRARGKTALSINWGVLAAAGMAEQVVTAHGDLFSKHGFLPHGSDEAVQIFADLIEGNSAQVLVGHFDWNRFADRYVRGKPPGFYDEVCGGENARAQKSHDARASVAHSILRDLEVAPAGQKMRVLTRFIEQQAAAVLGFTAGQAVDRKVPLNEQGLDSLLAVELRNVLSASLSVSLPATMLFDYPTINVLSEHIGNSVMMLMPQSEQDEALIPDTEDEHAVLASNISGMAEDEAEELLQQELDSLAADDRN